MQYKIKRLKKPSGKVDAGQMDNEMDTVLDKNASGARMLLQAAVKNPSKAGKAKSIIEKVLKRRNNSCIIRNAGAQKRFIHAGKANNILGDILSERNAIAAKPLKKVASGPSQVLRAVQNNPSIAGKAKKVLEKVTRRRMSGSIGDAKAVKRLGLAGKANNILGKFIANK